MTLFPFLPSPQAPFQFQPTLDGTVYNVIVTWSLFGQRYYINVYDLSGDLIVSRALVGSPSGIKLQSVSWSLGRVTAVALVPHGFQVGQTLDLMFSDITPVAYNGLFSTFVTSPTKLSYDLGANPGGHSTALGSVSYDIDLVGEYFSASTLVYREANQQFEVAP